MELDSTGSCAILFSDSISHSEVCRLGVTLPDRTVGMAERPTAAHSDDYVVAALAVMFFVMAIIVHRSHNTLRSRLRDFFSNKRRFSDERVNENSNESLNIFLLTSISALSLTVIYIDDLADFYQFGAITLPPYWLYAAGYAACMLFIHAKAMLYAVVNWVFFDRESSHRWLSDYLLLTSLTAFVLYPISLIDVFQAYSHAVVTTGVILVAAFYEILLFYKLFVNFKAKKYGYLLLFLYFCSVELMPALVLWTFDDWLNHHFIIQNLLY